MPNEPLPPNRVLAQNALRARMLALFAMVAVTGFPLPKMHDRPRYPKKDTEDIALKFVDDPVMGAKDPFLYCIELGLPTWQENPYTDDTHTEVIINYPMTFMVDIVDNWDKPELEVQNSADLAMLFFLRASKFFTENRTLGYHNVEHQYLQQYAADPVANDEGEALNYQFDWSLRIVISGFSF